jgi:hypothetical protein
MYFTASSTYWAVPRVRTSVMRHERFECTKYIIDLRVRLYTAPAPGRVVARVHPVGVTLHRVLALTRRHAPDAPSYRRSRTRSADPPG